MDTTNLELHKNLMAHLEAMAFNVHDYQVRGRDKNFVLTKGSLYLLEFQHPEGKPLQVVGWFDGSCESYGITHYRMLSHRGTHEQGFHFSSDFLTKAELLNAVDHRLERSEEVPGEQPGTFEGVLGSLRDEPQRPADPPGPVEGTGRRITWREFL